MTYYPILDFLQNRPKYGFELTAPTMIAALSLLKTDAVDAGNQDLAKQFYILESIAAIQDNFIQAFEYLKRKDYYNAWCKLDDVENQIESLAPHVDTDSDEFHLQFISQHVHRYQSLFPYRIFNSPEIVHLGAECSICDKRVTVRNPCGHLVGEIYDGKMCYRRATDIRFVGVAITEVPIMKANVLFLSDPVTKETIDQHDYTEIDWLASRLELPFLPWDAKRTHRMYSHTDFAGLGTTELCPCRSGLEYGECCMSLPAIRVPHIEFTVSWAAKDTGTKLYRRDRPPANTSSKPNNTRVPRLRRVRQRKQ